MFIIDSRELKFKNILIQDNKANADGAFHLAHIGLCRVEDSVFYRNFAKKIGAAILDYSAEKV